MKVSVALTPAAGLPAPIGAHELAWSYLLDIVIADAYTRELAALHVVLPQPLEREIALRAELSTQNQHTGGKDVGVALLGANPCLPKDAMRLYTLERGGLIAFTRLRASPTADGWRVARQHSVYCLHAHLWGGLIRAANSFSNRAMSDWAMYRMRRAFARSSRRLAFYQLTIWERA